MTKKARGTLITESLTNTYLLLLNPDSLTRVPSRRDPTSTDLTIASSHIALNSKWCTLMTLSSIYILIIVKLGSSSQMNLPKPPDRTFTILKKSGVVVKRRILFIY